MSNSIVLPTRATRTVRTPARRPMTRLLTPLDVASRARCAAAVVAADADPMLRILVLRRVREERSDAHPALVSPVAAAPAPAPRCSPSVRRASPLWGQLLGMLLICAVITLLGAWGAGWLHTRTALADSALAPAPTAVVHAPQADARRMPSMGWF